MELPTPTTPGIGTGGLHTRCTPPVVEQLKEVLRTHPGVTEVHLRLQSREDTKVLKVGDNFRVAAGAPLYADLKHLLGPGCLSG